MVDKKDKKETLDNDLDFSDLEDFDSDNLNFDDIDLEGRDPSTSSVSKELAKEAGKGFLSSLIKKTTEKSLPEEYSANYTTILDYSDLAREIVDKNKGKLETSLYKMGREVNKLLPIKIGILDRLLKKYEEDKESSTIQSEENIRSSAIASSLESIFDKQLDIQKAIESKRDATDEVESKTRLVQSKLNLDILSSIDGNIANHTAFTLQVSKEYYRKSLELQFKSYYIQADLLKTVRDYYKGFSVQFDTIVKNTGLPDFVKLTTIEHSQELLRSKVLDKVHTRLFNDNQYVDLVKSRIDNFISSKIADFTDQVDTITGQLDLLNSAGESTGSSILPGLLSSLLGSTVGEKLAENISPKIKDKIKDNTNIKIGANYLASLGSSPTTFFADLRGKVQNKLEDNERSDSIFNSIQNAFLSGADSLLGLTSLPKQNLNIATNNILDHAKPAIFDNKTHNAITDVIPMYLSEILKQNTDLSKMFRTANASKLKDFKETSPLVYDYQKRQLDTIENFRSSVENKLLTNRNVSARSNIVASNLLSSTSNILSRSPTATKEDKSLISSVKTKKLLSEYISSASKIEGIEINYDTLIGNIDSESTPIELKELLNSNSKLRNVIQTIRSSREGLDNTQISSHLSDIVKEFPTTAIKELISQTSKLANSPILNQVTDKEALAIAKIFYRYIKLTGEDITLIALMTGQVLNRVTQQELNTIEDVMSILMKDLLVIHRLDDALINSNMLVLLSAVNSSLRNMEEVNIDVFKSLDKLDSRLLPNKDITPEQLIQGKLTGIDVDEFVSKRDILTLGKTNAQELANIRSSRLADRLSIKSDPSRFEELVSELSEAKGNPLAIGRVIISNAKTEISRIRSQISSKYSAVKTSVEDLKTDISALYNTSVEDSKSKILEKSVKYLSSVQDIINTEEKLYNEEVRILQTTLKDMSNNLSNPTGKAEIEKTLVRKKRLHDISMKSLNVTKNSIEVFINRTKDRDFSTSSIESTMNSIKQDLTEIVNFIVPAIEDLETQQKEEVTT